MLVFLTVSEALFIIFTIICNQLWLKNQIIIHNGLLGSWLFTWDNSPPPSDEQNLICVAKAGNSNVLKSSLVALRLDINYYQTIQAPHITRPVLQYNCYYCIHRGNAYQWTRCQVIIHKATTGKRLCPWPLRWVKAQSYWRHSFMFWTQ